jgi:DNA-directed RNA polymerase specialized sigma24 family protein
MAEPIHVTPAEKPPFEDLYRTYQGYVYRRVYALVQRREEAEDLTQETFLKAWQATRPQTKPWRPPLRVCQRTIG